MGGEGKGREFLPLLNAVEALKGGDGDKDGNSLLAVANLDLERSQSQHASSRMQLSRERTGIRGPLPVLFHYCIECF